MLKILFLVSTMSISSVGTDVQNVVNLVLGVQKYFTSGCIYLLQDHVEYWNSTQTTIQISKLLSQRFIQIAQSSKNGSVKCDHNRPLFVIPDSERELNRSLVRDHSQTAIWLKFMRSQTPLDFFGNRDIPFDCEFLLAIHEDGESPRYTLEEIYRVSPTLPFMTYHFGEWDPHYGLNPPSKGFYERRNTLLGAVLKTAVQPDSKLLLSPDDDVFHNSAKDFFNEVWLVLRDIMDFKPEYHVTDLNVNGMKLNNGSWNGIIGLLDRKEAEVSCEGLSMTPGRAEVLDFMVPIKMDRHYLVIKKSNSNELSWNSFLLPFSTKIWFAVLFTILLLTLMLWTTYRLCSQYWKEFLEEFNSFFRLQDTFFYILGSFCQQGLERVPSPTSARVVCLVSYLNAVILLAGYSASLISNLTLRKPDLPFSTFEGLLASSYKFGIAPFSSSFQYFKDGKDPLYHEIYERLVSPHKHSLPSSSAEGLRRVCELPKYTFLSDLAVEEHQNEFSCHLFPLPEAYLPGSRAMAVIRNSPYRGLFSHYLLKIRSVGILKRLKLWTSNKSTDEEVRFITMDLFSVAPMFAILVAGTIIAIFILIFEIIFSQECPRLNICSSTTQKKYPSSWKTVWSKMAYLILFVISALIILPSLCSGSNELFLNIISEVKKRFFSNCIYFSQVEFSDYKLFLEIAKKDTPSYNYVSTSSKTSSRGNGCRRRIIVIILKQSTYWSVKQELLANERLSESIWLFLSNGKILMEEFLSDVDIPFDCEFLVAKLEAGNVVLNEVYRVAPTLPLLTHKFGTWSGNKILWRSPVEMYSRRNNLQGLMLKTAVKEGFFDGEFYSSGRGRNYFCSQIWFMFIEYLNFTSLYSYSYEMGNGINLQDGLWTGIVGMLHNGEVHATAEGISMRNERMEIVDYISPIWTERIYPFMQATKIFRISWNNFLHPFELDIWIALMMTIILISSGFSLIGNRWSCIQNDLQERPVFGFFGTLFHVIGSFLNQVQDLNLQSPSSSLLRLVSHWTSTIIIASYSAFFISFLTLRHSVLPFDSFEELLKDGTYKLGILPYSSLQKFFKNAKNNVLGEVYRRVIVPYNSSLPTSSLEGLQRVCSDLKYAQMYPLEGIAKYTDKLKCQIMLAPHAKLETLKSMATVKGSPYIGIFRHITFKMYESGIIKKLLLKTVTELADVEEPEGIVDLKTVIPVLYIFLFGILLAIVILALELVYYRMQPKVKNLNEFY